MSFGFCSFKRITHELLSGVDKAPADPAAWGEDKSADHKNMLRVLSQFIPFFRDKPVFTISLSRYGSSFTNYRESPIIESLWGPTVDPYTETNIHEFAKICASGS
jgi:hypothetical protein